MHLLLKVNQGMDEFYQTIPDNSQNSNCGYDLYFDNDYIIPSREKVILKFGIRASVVNSENEEVSYLLLPRSSISKTPLVQVNSIGLIDASYRGEIMAVVLNYENKSYSVLWKQRQIYLF